MANPSVPPTSNGSSDILSSPSTAHRATLASSAEKASGLDQTDEPSAIGSDIATRGESAPGARRIPRVGVGSKGKDLVRGSDGSNTPLRAETGPISSVSRTSSSHTVASAPSLSSPIKSSNDAESAADTDSDLLFGDSSARPSDTSLRRASTVRESINRINAIAERPISPGTRRMSSSSTRTSLVFRSAGSITPATVASGSTTSHALDAAVVAPSSYSPIWRLSQGKVRRHLTSTSASPVDRRTASTVSGSEMSTNITTRSAAGSVGSSAGFLADVDAPNDPTSGTSLSALQRGKGRVVRVTVTSQFHRSPRGALQSGSDEEEDLDGSSSLRLGGVDPITDIDTDLDHSELGESGVYLPAYHPPIFPVAQHSGRRIDSTVDSSAPSSAAGSYSSTHPVLSPLSETISGDRFHPFYSDMVERESPPMEKRVVAIAPHPGNQPMPRLLMEHFEQRPTRLEERREMGKEKVDRSDWMRKVMHRNPDMANLRARIQPLNRAISFCELYNRGRGKMPVPKEMVLQLIMQYLDHEGLRGPLKVLEKESGAPFQFRNLDELQLLDSRLITLIMLAINDIETIWDVAMGEKASSRLSSSDPTTSTSTLTPTSIPTSTSTSTHNSTSSQSVINNTTSSPSPSSSPHSQNLNRRPSTNATTAATSGSKLPSPSSSSPSTSTSASAMTTATATSAATASITGTTSSSSSVSSPSTVNASTELPNNVEYDESNIGLSQDSAVAAKQMELLNELLRALRLRHEDQFVGYSGASDALQNDVNIWEQLPEVDQLLVETDTGLVAAGSLNRLVELLAPEEEVDLTYVRAFLVTYQLFTTSSALLAKLSQRYNVPRDPTVPDDEWRKRVLPIQIRVVNVIKSWIEEFHSDFDDTTVSNIRDFLNFQVRESHPALAATTLTLLEKLCSKDDDNGSFYEQRRAMTPSSPSSPSSNSSYGGHSSSRIVQFSFSVDPPRPIVPKNVFSPNLTWEDVDEEELARQLTLIEFEYIYKIRTPEFLHQSWSRPKLKHRSPHILSMIRRFNVVSDWVGTQIVIASKLRQRAQVLTKLIGIAEHLRKLQNYNTLMAFVAVFNSSAIHRLKHTLSELPQKAMDTLTELKRLMRPDDAYLQYRLELEQCLPPCVPYIGLYLTELTHAEDGQPTYTDGLINFSKCRLIHSIIAHVNTHQQKGYNIQAVYQIQQLLRDPQPRLGDKAIISHSSLIEPRGADKSQIVQ